MNPLREDDIEQARRATPEEKARQALEMMRCRPVEAGRKFKLRILVR